MIALFDPLCNFGHLERGILWPIHSTGTGAHVYGLYFHSSIHDFKRFCTKHVFQLQQEGRILLGLKNHVVPKIGESVRVLNLANSQALTSGVVGVSIIIATVQPVL